jgi:hypothetical protein
VPRPCTKLEQRIPQDYNGSVWRERRNGNYTQQWLPDAHNWPGCLANEKKKNEMRDLIINAINIGYRYFDCAGTLTCSFLYICNLNFFCIFKSLLVF